MTHQVFPVLGAHPLLGGFFLEVGQKGQLGVRAAPSALEVRSAEGRPGMGVEYCPRDVAV
jgi:hypothetical protein